MTAPDLWLAARGLALAALGIPAGATLLLLFMQLVPGRWEQMRPAAARLAIAAPVAALAVALVVLPVATDRADGGFRADWLRTPWFELRTIVTTAAFAGFGWAAGHERVSIPTAVAGLIILPLLASFAAYDWVQVTWPNYHSAQYGLQFVAQLWLGGIAAILLLTMRRTPGPPEAAAVGVLIASLILWAHFWAMTYLVNWSAALPEEARWWLARQAGVPGLALAVLAIAGFLVPFGVLLLPAARANRGIVMTICATALGLRIVEMLWLLLPGRA